MSLAKKIEEAERALLAVQRTPGPRIRRASASEVYTWPTARRERVDQLLAGLESGDPGAMRSVRDTYAQVERGADAFVTEIARLLGTGDHADRGNARSALQTLWDRVAEIDGASGPSEGEDQYDREQDRIERFKEQRPADTRAPSSASREVRAAYRRMTPEEQRVYDRTDPFKPKANPRATMAGRTIEMAGRILTESECVARMAELEAEYGFGGRR
jgi:hypothetical protein